MEKTNIDPKTISDYDPLGKHDGGLVAQTIKPVVDQEYLIRVLAYGNFGGIQTTDKYYVIYDFGDFKIQLRIESLAIDFWIQEKSVAYVPVSIAIPAVKTSCLSGSIRFVFGRLLDELKRNGTIKG